MLVMAVLREKRSIRQPTPSAHALLDDDAMRHIHMRSAPLSMAVWTAKFDGQPSCRRRCLAPCDRRPALVVAAGRRVRQRRGWRDPCARSICRECRCRPGRDRFRRRAIDKAAEAHPCAAGISNTWRRYATYARSAHMFLPVESLSLGTSWPLQRTILITMLSGAGPTSLVRLAPTSKASRPRPL